MNYIKIYEEFSRKRHNLSGIILLVEDRMLLVHPRKFKGDDKWSIPKGHVEGKPLRSALKELKEETGIRLFTKPEAQYKYKYRKNGVNKVMRIYLYRLEKADVQKYLKDGWEIKTSIYDRKEIWKAKFFKLDNVKKRLEGPLKGIMKKFAYIDV